MKEDKSSVDRLNDTLNSRTDYNNPVDKRSAVHEVENINAPEKWDSPELDSMIKERRAPNPEPTKMKRFFMVSVLFFIAAFVLAGYVYLRGGNFVSTKNVDIKVTGPAVIEAGKPLSLTITVENNNNAELVSADLSIMYPEGTRQSDDATIALPRDRVAIGSIHAGGESVQTFNSVLFGQKGDVKTIKLLLRYKITGSSASFSKDKTFDVTIGDTPIAIGIERPSTITSGAEFITKILVASNSTDVLKGVVIRAEYPYGYVVSESNPEAITGNNIWNVGDLAPGDKKEISLRGSISGVDEEERTFRFYAGIADPGNPSNLKTPLVSMTETLHIARPSVGLSISMNGESTGDYIAPAGGVISALITYRNNATERLVDPKLVVKITGPSLDKASIRPGEGGFYDSNTGVITWQSPNTPSFEEVAPGDTGSVSVSFASLSALPVGKSQQIDMQATITGTPGGVASAGPISANDSKSVKIASTVNFSGKALYSRGPYKNIGPIPPKAEATTTYTIVLDLGNTQNEVQNGKVTARLGSNVTLVKPGFGADGVTYNESTNTITWNVGTLASGTGFTGAPRESVFQVSLKPSIGQIGTVPSLVTNINFEGKDVFTNLPVTATIPSITTRLSTDSKFVQGDDIVVK